MKVLIKGAGDLATGIAYRLYNSGYSILMTEIAVPTAVRRSVSFSRAVYEKKAVVEAVCGVLAHTIKEVYEIQARKEIPIFIDEKAEIEKEYKPDVVIDAIIAKKNTGTTIDEASFVIGVGPGFTAGIDCHRVIETKRGHYLGRVIKEGSAIPNTGIPGDIGGFTTERIIRATANGIFEPIVSIGDMVEEGQCVAYSGGMPIYAKMSGLVRGMLQKGVLVKEGMKAGDIDARSEREHCFTISDKARAIGGGVLEAVCAFEHKKKNL